MKSQPWQYTDYGCSSALQISGSLLGVKRRGRPLGAKKKPNIQQNLPPLSNITNLQVSSIHENFEIDLAALDLDIQEMDRLEAEALSNW